MHCVRVRRSLVLGVSRGGRTSGTGKSLVRSMGVIGNRDHSSRSGNGDGMGIMNRAMGPIISTLNSGSTGRGARRCMGRRGWASMVSVDGVGGKGGERKAHFDKILIANR